MSSVRVPHKARYFRIAVPTPIQSVMAVSCPYCGAAVNAPCVEKPLAATTHAVLIANVIARHSYQSYLEIGCQGDATFNAVDVPRKVGVDAISGGTLRMTSDEYFTRNDERFDAIFIDANHHHDQVYLDALHALRVLNPDGMLFLHDCAPPDAAHEAPHLCHTAWRAFAWLRQHPGLDGIVANWDFGTALIRVRENVLPVLIPAPMGELAYEDFLAHKRDWMRLSDAGQVEDWLNE